MRRAPEDAPDDPPAFTSIAPRILARQSVNSFPFPGAGAETVLGNGGTGRSWEESERTRTSPTARLLVYLTCASLSGHWSTHTTLCRIDLRTRPILVLTSRSILGANRDEFLGRPTEPAHFHTFGRPGGDVLSGLDVRAGGTWLGINRRGRIAVLCVR